MRLHPLFGTLRLFAFAAACTAAMGAMPLPAQDSSAPPPAGQDNQGQPPHEGRPDPAAMQARRLDMMTKRLNLSPDQVSQIKAIDDDQVTQMRGLRDDTSMSRDDKRSKMMAMRDASNQKVRAVLNDEQKTKYDAMQAHRRDHMHDHGNGQEPPPPPPSSQQ